MPDNMVIKSIGTQSRTHTHELIGMELSQDAL